MISKARPRRQKVIIKVMGRFGQRSRNVTRLIDCGIWEKNHADMGRVCK